MKLALVCLGGAFGSGARYLLAGWITSLTGPAVWGTWAVNVIGCFLIEIVVQAAQKAGLSSMAVLALTTGVLGGFTTYSAFNQQVLALFRAGQWAGAAYLGATVAGCLLAGVAGVLVGQALWGR
jgi:CrcB protein